ncbi:MAG TPA: MIP/aquaporin family protein [Thermoanaerobaculia bacterium]|nr:MIP/aquaporin family protein [Thermoanaerobaculia bacterium]
MEIFIAEMVGTALLVLLGDGVVANHLLRDTKGNGTGWVMITTGWAMAVALSVYAIGRISGGHINPAVTLGLFSIGQVDGGLVPVYIAAQMTGAILGAVLVWLAYLPHWGRTEDQGAKLAVFCTGPAIRSTPSNFLCEAIGTFVLMFGVLAIGANAGEMIGELDLSVVFSTGINPLLVGFLVWGIGLSLGGPTGYAINPARDLGPRIAHAILPIPGKGGSDWGYAWIPVAGPIVGAAVGALTFKVLFG